MLSVYYKEKLGEFTEAKNGESIKIGIYRCNALAAFVNRKKEGDVLWAFFANKYNMRNIEKDFKPFFSIKGAVRLNMAYPESNDLLGFFARQGHTIKPYNKPPKKKGK